MRRATRSACVRSASWPVYNIINFSIPGILTEVFAMCSIIVGILRIDLPKMRKKK
jgi:hypothetical protein